MVGQLKAALPIDLTVGQSLPLRSGDQTLTLELSGFKAINVENMGGNPEEPVNAQDPFQRNVASVLSPAINKEKEKQLRNVGPAINYKLRDASGQAREFHVYMLPVELDGNRVYLAGVRDSPDQQFKYLRVPADAKDSMDEFIRVRAALTDPAMRAAAAKKFAAQSAPENLVPALADSAERALDAIANGGIQALGDLLETTVPEVERERAAEVVLRLLAGTFWELWQQSRVRDGLSVLPRNDDNMQFAQLALTAVSDAQIFGAPLLVTMTDFEEVKASVFQVTRSPGKTTVYVGCLLLVLGIFAMLYIQERRIWVWMTPEQDGFTLKVAASTPRLTLDFQREFSSLAQVVKNLRAS
jgi:cytochrome c biogenesis protein